MPDFDPSASAVASAGEGLPLSSVSNTARMLPLAHPQPQCLCFYGNLSMPLGRLPSLHLSCDFIYMPPLSSLIKDIICFVFLFLFFPFWGAEGDGVQDRVSLHSLGCPGTDIVEEVGLELRDLPAPASQVLGSDVCVITAQLTLHFLSEF